MRRARPATASARRRSGSRRVLHGGRCRAAAATDRDATIAAAALRGWARRALAQSRRTRPWGPARPRCGAPRAAGVRGSAGAALRRPRSPSRRARAAPAAGLGLAVLRVRSQDRVFAGELTPADEAVDVVRALVGDDGLDVAHV